MSASGAERKTNSNLGFKLATPSSKRDNETIKEGTTVGVSTIPLNFFDVAVAAAVAVTDKQLLGIAAVRMRNSLELEGGSRFLRNGGNVPLRESPQS